MYLYLYPFFFLLAIQIARILHTSVTLKGDIYILGGNTGSAALNDVFKSTNYGTSWSLVTGSSMWSPRYGHESLVIVVTGLVDTLLVLGGQSGTPYSSTSTCFNDVYKSVTSGLTWDLVRATSNVAVSNQWSGRAQFKCALMGSTIIVTGGCDFSVNPSICFRDVWQSTDISGASWRVSTLLAQWAGNHLYFSSFIVHDFYHYIIIS
jgi:hypothetical protein